LTLTGDDFRFLFVGKLGSISALAISGLWAMFSLVVVLAYMSGDRAGRAVQGHRAEGEPSNVFEDVGVLDGADGIFAPSKRSVTGNENARNGDRVQAF
jgi:hypothetical protein